MHRNPASHMKCLEFSQIAKKGLNTHIWGGGMATQHRAHICWGKAISLIAYYPLLIELIFFCRSPTLPFVCVECFVHLISEADVSFLIWISFNIIPSFFRMQPADIFHTLIYRFSMTWNVRVWESARCYYLRSDGCVHREGISSSQFKMQ